MLDTSITTFNGGIFDFMEPDLTSLTIEDIAHALSMMCRFNGHVSDFYSVAEHCVLGTAKVPEPLKLAFLLHDASEAFIADIVTPAKRLLSNYLDLERSIQEAVAFRFGLDPILFQHPLVRDADIRMCMTERNALQPKHNKALWVSLEHHEPYDDVVVQCWPPYAAKHKFVKLFKELV